MVESIITNLGQIIIAIIGGYCLIKVNQLKIHINSRMDELIKLTKESSFAEGKLEGKLEGQSKNQDK